MSEWLSRESELLAGLAAVIVIWLAMIGIDMWRRAKGLKRRTTSPVRQWVTTMVILWALAAVTVWAWTASGRQLEAMGFQMGQAGLWGGLAWGMTIAFIGFQALQVRAVYRDESVRDEARQAMFGSLDYDQIMPRRRKDCWGFFLLGTTAGITEEIVFRAFLIGVFALIMPLWAAALVALFMFIVGHAYQGVQGMVRILPVSAILTLVYVLSGSLVPAILLHVAVDVLSGVMMWLVLPREGYIEVDEMPAPQNA